MPIWYWIVILLPLFIMIMEMKDSNEYINRKITNKHNSKEKQTMKELLMRYVDKDCVIHTLKTTYLGRLTEVTDDGVVIIEKGNEMVINLDYIMQVEETPKNKKGKRKSIIT